MCNHLDNDCNGCRSDGLCCGGLLDCPGPGDARIPAVQPYTDLTIDGSLFFPDTGATSWVWTVDGGPCDRLFKTTTVPVTQSFTLTNDMTSMPTVHFTLSGDYTIKFTARGSDGKTYTCTWVQHVIGPGVRFELCWDKTGQCDLDLHVHRSDTTTPWFTTVSGSSNTNADDCYYLNCKASSGWTGPPPGMPSSASTPVWGYANSPIAACVGSPSGPGWVSTLNACANPRLDIDNISTLGKPENTNIDRPKNGETFRSMVHYYGSSVETHPVVNVYCGGVLKATYGAAPNTLGPCPGPTCFDRGAGWDRGLMWRVADVTAMVDASGNTYDCNVAAIHPPAMGDGGTPSGYYVTNNDDTY